MAKQREKTPFEKAGYTLDTKFRCIKEYGDFMVGDILQAREDDGSHYPFFTNKRGVVDFMYLPRYKDEDEIEVYQEQPKEESFPTIETRTPHVSKVDYYRVHFNELYSRDISKEEAEAIYDQLKTLLEK